MDNGAAPENFTRLGRGNPCDIIGGEPPLLKNFRELFSRRKIMRMC